MEKNICLYFHLKKGTNIVFYVGIGIGRRATSKLDRNVDWFKTVNKYGYDIVIKFTNLSWKSACILEKSWIKKIGRRDKGLGTLVNQTDGGDGTFGFEPWNKGVKLGVSYFKGKKHSDKTRKIISDSKKGIIPWNKGLFKPKVYKESVLFTDEQRRVIGERSSRLFSGDNNPMSKVNIEKRRLNKIKQEACR